ncbi:MULTISPECIES: hypothetical protein [unclassified Dyella]|uniref:hypothetical protein n=1 Tax=unclassified Dyella TaxID=2634549 RepID=UPI003F93A93F
MASAAGSQGQQGPAPTFPAVWPSDSYDANNPADVAKLQAEYAGLKKFVPWFAQNGGQDFGEVPTPDNVDDLRNFGLSVAQAYAAQRNTLPTVEVVPQSQLEQDAQATAESREESAQYLNSWRTSDLGDLAADSVTLLTDGGNSLIGAGKSVFDIATDYQSFRQFAIGTTLTVAHPINTYDRVTNAVADWYALPLDQQARSIGDAGMSILTFGGAEAATAKTFAYAADTFDAIRSVTSPGAFDTSFLEAPQGVSVPLTGAGASGVANPTISIFGFRGAGSVEDLLVDGAPHPYVITGHVGYSFDGGQTIYGFGPSVPEGMSAYDAVQSLRNGASYPGVITDDTAIFQSVANNPAMSRGGLPQAVIEQQIPLAQADFDAIQAAHNSIGVGNPMNDVLYGFPGQNACTFNCATFPSHLGIPIPEATGNMRSYMPLLEQRGQLWTPQ